MLATVGGQACSHSRFICWKNTGISSWLRITPSFTLLTLSLLVRWLRGNQRTRPCPVNTRPTLCFLALCCLLLHSLCGLSSSVLVSFVRFSSALFVCVRSSSSVLSSSLPLFFRALFFSALCVCALFFLCAFFCALCVSGLSSSVFSSSLLSCVFLLRSM